MNCGTSGSVRGAASNGRPYRDRMAGGCHVGCIGRNWQGDRNAHAKFIGANSQR